jgi:hypothetical protein
VEESLPDKPTFEKPRISGKPEGAANIVCGKPTPPKAEPEGPTIAGFPATEVVAPSPPPPETANNTVSGVPEVEA